MADDDMDGPAAAGIRRLFVYYRVPLGRLSDVLPHVRAAQVALAGVCPGLQTGLMRRPEVRDGEVTLMETYALDADVSPAGLDAALIDEIDRAVAAALAALPCGERHAEVFDACA